MFRNKKRLLSTIIVAVAGLVSVAIGIMLGLGTSSLIDHRSVKDDKFEALIEGMTAPDGLPPNGMLVTPASEQSWYDLFPYVSRITYLLMPYEVIGDEAEHFISISANGTNDDSSTVVGSFKYPVLGISYSSEREADKAKERAMTAVQADPELTDAKFFTKGNILYFMLLATYTDDQMSIASLPASLTFKDLKSWGVKEGESYWYINFGAFLDSYKETLEDEKYATGIDSVLGKAGFSNDSYWVGTSKDLETWDGRFYNIDVSKVSPKDFLAHFNTLYKKVNNGDPNDWEYYTLGGVVPDSNIYNIEQAQSMLAAYTEVATKSGTAGSIDTIIPDEGEEGTVVNSDGEEVRGGLGENLGTLDKLPADSPYAVTFKIDPNAWLGFLKGGDVLQASRVIFMKTLTADIKLNGEARLTVEPYTMEEYAEDVRKSLANAERVESEQSEVNSQGE